MPKFRTNTVYANMPTAAELKIELARVETAIEQANRSHGDLALRSIAGDEGAAAELEALQHSLTDDQQRLITLRSAVRQAEINEARAVRTAQAAMFKSQLAAIAQHLAQRDKHAAEVTEALQAYDAALRQMVKCNKSIVAALPAPWRVEQLPRDAMLSFRLLKLDIEHEIFRVAHGDQSSLGYPNAAPGAKVLHLNPDDMEAFPERCKRVGKYLHDLLSGKIEKPEPVAMQAIETSYKAVVDAHDENVEAPPSLGDMRVKAIVPEPQS